MSKQKFHLTRESARNLAVIHARSVKQWGPKTADNYLAKIYDAMKKAAMKPEAGRLRSRRAVPFLMISAVEHFIVYDRLGDEVVILAILHQRRNIERIIADMGPAFFAEIEYIRQRMKN